MLLTDLVAIVHDNASARIFLQQYNILRTIPPNCNTCDRIMTEVRRTGNTDGIIYRCPNHRNTSISIRHKSFVANAHVSLHQFVLLVYLWAHRTPVTTAVSMLGISEHSIIDWYNMVREICSTYLIHHRQQIGGVGHVVEIDESLVARRKYNQGHLVAERWVFGGYDTTTGVGFLHIVPDRSANSLLPLIEQYIAPGSTIHSDQWAAYNGIAAIPMIPPYVHLTVNHQQNYVDPITGATTNHVECFWKNMKMKLKQMHGTRVELLPSHLDEFMWRQLRGPNGAEAFVNILGDIAEQFPIA